MRKLRLLFVTGLIAGSLISGTAIASADADTGAFLCPVVGDGVLNADAHNGDNRVSAIQPPVGTSLLPGNNQAGANANPSSYNSDGPGNPDFSPIWPGG